jgi:hypothetical protein
MDEFLDVLHAFQTLELLSGTSVVSGEFRGKAIAQGVPVYD